MSPTAVPLPPSTPLPAQILMRSADRAIGWFYHWCPSLGLLPEWLLQFRPSKIEGPEPNQTRARREGKLTGRNPAPSNPPAPRPAVEFGRVETVQNTKPPLQSEHQPGRRPERESSTR